MSIKSTVIFLKQNIHYHVDINFYVKDLIGLPNDRSDTGSIAMEALRSTCDMKSYRKVYFFIVRQF